MVARRRGGGSKRVNRPVGGKRPRKAAGLSRAGRRSSKKRGFSWRKALLFGALVLLIGGGTLLLWSWPKIRARWLPRESVVRPVPRSFSLPVPVFPPSKERAKKEAPLLPRPQARVAILIDDLGGSLPAARSLLEMDAPLSFAILPFLPHSKTIAQWAQERRRDVLLHLPLEPHGYPQIDPGKGALLEEMSEGLLAERLAENLEAVPYIVGVNHHMGSRFTEDERAMRVVLGVLRRRGLFYVDSRTTPKSVAYRLAREMGLKSGERWVFLDHPVGRKAADVRSVEKQLEKLVRLARKEGQAIAIGHPHSDTLQALRQSLPRMMAEGVAVVPVSALMR